MTKLRQIFLCFLRTGAFMWYYQKQARLNTIYVFVILIGNFCQSRRKIHCGQKVDTGFWKYTKLYNSFINAALQTI